MTKRKQRKYRLLKFYEEDFYGNLVLKDPKDIMSKHLGFKILKINKLLYERLKTKIDNRKYYSIKDPFNKFKFYYRTDITKRLRRRRRLSTFAFTLKMRQKLRHFVNKINVRQLRSYIKKAAKNKFLFKNFLFLLESRIDFILRRLNLVESGGEGRQLINHGRVIVNGKRAFFGNKRLKFLDFFSVDMKSFFFQKILNSFKNKKIFMNVPSYLEVNYRILTAVIVHVPEVHEVPYPSKFKPQIIVSLGKKYIN